MTPKQFIEYLDERIAEEGKLSRDMVFGYSSKAPAFQEIKHKFLSIEQPASQVPFNVNAAQVLRNFIWQNMPSLNIVTGTAFSGFKINQTLLLDYLMKFQHWMFEQQTDAKP